MPVAFLAEFQSEAAVQSESTLPTAGSKASYGMLSDGARKIFVYQTRSGLTLFCRSVNMRSSEGYPANNERERYEKNNFSSSDGSRHVPYFFRGCACPEQG